MTKKHSFLRNYILPAGDAVFGQQMIARLKFLEKAQFWPQKDILEKQSEDLRRLIGIAYREVPFYHSLFENAKIRPDQIRRSEDLELLPVVTKNDLREGYPALTTRFTGQRTYEVSTSGSTGKNFYVREDFKTAGWYRATFLLTLEWTGWSIGEPHLQTGMTIKRSLDRKLKDWIFGCYYVSAYKLDDAHLTTMLEIIDKHHLEYVWGYPGSIFYLAKHAVKLGWNKPLKAVVTWGDSLLPDHRSLIESAFQTTVYDNYGCAEGVQISAQCEYGNYHLHALDAVIEFLDEEGHAVSPGETGNIVLTRLHPGPMPLIRYSVGDLGVPSQCDSCKCGRGFPLMQSLLGRNVDVITTPSGNRLIVHYFTGVLEHFDEIDSFQVVQEAPDSIILRIVPKKVVSEETEKKIINAIKKKGAADIEIEIEIVEEIPLSPAGKHRFIINKTTENLAKHNPS